MPNETLKPFRDLIDLIDDQMVDLLAQRMDIVRQVGAIKKRENMNLVQTDRVCEVRERCAARGIAGGLNPGFVRRLWETIIDEAHELEQDIISRT